MQGGYRLGCYYSLTSTLRIVFAVGEGMYVCMYVSMYGVVYFQCNVEVCFSFMKFVISFVYKVAR